ncbi:MAG TPA: efflux RND transporter periplasmic adaptor subunit [Planctomycetota bacterium]|nr:efflux RND transporter periplasmic adaptor subunit [Planctomycetota bacterium]
MKKTSLLIIVSLALAGSGWFLLRARTVRAQEGEKKPLPASNPNEVWLAPEQEDALGIKTQTAEKKIGDHPIVTGGKVSLDLERTARVRPLLNSIIYEVKKRAGDEVQKGDALLVVESTDLGDAKNNYLTALANLEVAAETYKREAFLRLRHATTETDYHNARAGFRTAVVASEAAREKCLLLGVRGQEMDELESELPLGASAQTDDEAEIKPPDDKQREEDARAAAHEVARRRVHRTQALSDDDNRRRARYTIRAPIDGTLLTKDAARGEFVDPSQVIATVSDLRELWINIDVYQKDIPKVKAGARVDVVTPTYPDTAFVGSITFLGESVDETTHTLRARVTVDNSKAPHLKSGMAAKTIVHCVDEKPEIALPPEAVVRDGSDTFVVVKRESRQSGGVRETRYEKRKVKLGLEAEDAVHVEDGLTEGETVVVEGNIFIHTKITLGD